MKRKISLCCFIIILLQTIFIGMPGQKRVYAAEGTQLVSPSTLINTAAVLIRQRAGAAADSADLRVNVINSPQAVTVPEGEVALSVDLPYGVRYNAPTTANVTTSVNGQVVSVTTLKFEVKMYKQVLVAARSISIREVLTSDSLRYERLDVGRLGAGYYTDPSTIVGLITRRMISPGMPINQYMIEKPIIIKRGTGVTIVARIGNLEVTTSGQALQDGYEGKIIPVQNLNTLKVMSAKVLDETSVQVMTAK